MASKELEAKELHDGPFLTILWDTPMRTIGIRWKPSATKMSDEDFRTGPDVEEWRIKNISSRYAAAGVGRFAFLFPPGSEIPPMMNQSAESESFATRAFTRQEQAVEWLTET
jgi:hypothetical protein